MSAKLSKRMATALRTARPVEMGDGTTGHRLEPQRMSARQFSLWADSVRRLGFATWDSQSIVLHGRVAKTHVWLLTPKGERARSDLEAS